MPVPTLAQTCLQALANMIISDGQIVWQCGSLAGLPSKLLDRLLQLLQKPGGFARPVLSLFYGSALQSLNLRKCSWLDDASASELRPVHLPDLRELRIRGAPALGTRGLTHIATLSSLRVLEIASCEGLRTRVRGANSGGRALELLSRLEQLEELSLQECSLDIPVGSGLARLSTLTRLQLGGNQVQSGALVGLAPCLTELSAWGSTDLRCADVWALSDLLKLRRLDLRLTGVGATAAPALNALPMLCDLLLDMPPGPGPEWCSGLSASLLQRLNTFNARSSVHTRAAVTVHSQCAEELLRVTQPLADTKARVVPPASDPWDPWAEDGQPGREVDRAEAASRSKISPTKHVGSKITLIGAKFPCSDLCQRSYSVDDLLFLRQSTFSKQGSSMRSDSARVLRLPEHLRKRC